MCERTDDGVFVCAWWHHREAVIVVEPKTSESTGMSYDTAVAAGVVEPIKSETVFTYLYGACEFGCGWDDEGRLTIINACPVHGPLDLSKTTGPREQALSRARAEEFIRCTAKRQFPEAEKPLPIPDYTVEAQARLLRTILCRSDVEVYIDGEGLLVIDADIRLTPDEAAVARLVRSTR